MKGVSNKDFQEAMAEGPFAGVRLWIGVPSQSDCKMQFAMSLSLMIHHLTTQLIMFNVDNRRGSILPGLRQKIVDEALRQGATHLLFLDSDQIFPAELAAHWLNVNRPVLAANIATKADLSYPTAKKLVGGKLVPHYSDTAGEPYTKVARVGTGIMMLKREVLEKLPRPAFTPYWSAEANDYVYEDWVLCEHLEKLDYSIFVDNALSMVVGHVGDRVYGMDNVAATRRWEQEHVRTDQGSDHHPRIVTAR